MRVQQPHAPRARLVVLLCKFVHARVCGRLLIDGRVELQLRDEHVRLLVLMGKTRMHRSVLVQSFVSHGL